MPGPAQSLGLGPSALSETLAILFGLSLVLKTPGPLLGLEHHTMMAGACAMEKELWSKDAGCATN